MALRATVYRSDLTVSDLDRGVYSQHALTLARHPSETEERLMVRLLAFALHADESLVFGRGLSTEDEADLWQRDATGAIELWIDVGLPDEKDSARRAGARARSRCWRMAPGASTSGGATTNRPLEAVEPRVLHVDGRRDRSAGVARRALDATRVHHPGRDVWLGQRAGHRPDRAAAAPIERPRRPARRASRAVDIRHAASGVRTINASRGARRAKSHGVLVIIGGMATTLPATPLLACTVPIRGEFA